MKVLTEQFGEVELTADSIIHFDKGLIGFEKHNKFFLLNHEDYAPFRWLLSVEDQQVAFPVLDPFLVSPDFAKELPPKLVKRIFSSQETFDLFCIINLGGADGQATINLKSPILLDRNANTGEQLVLVSEALPVAMAIS